MIIRPMLGDYEMPRIERIHAVERRRLSRFSVPGLAGELQQDLGHDSLAVEIVGSLQGDDARDGFLSEIRQRYQAGDPLAFVADITSATQLDQVLIEALEVSEHNEWAGAFQYRLVLRQYVEPPEPPTPIDELGAGLDADLDLLAALGLDGLELPDLLGVVPDLGDPVAPVLPALDAVKSATAPLKDLLAGLKSTLA
ncbi:MAG: hypothetical protein HY020_24885 [Burkholderiales bacterium]|nr:hypothetical protein [Burkholderiales bacterium]